MTRKLLVLKGSPRSKGNSSVLAELAASGARESGAEVECINLSDLAISPCDACDACLESGNCIIEDDMQMLYPKLLVADAFILSSPIYWFTYSAQLKTCVDRWYALWNNHNDAFKNKPIGIILTYGDTDLYTSGGINAIHTFESMFRFLQANIVGWVYGSLMDVGDAQKSTQLMDKAYQLGRKLAG
jgi:multimeric flavodoxin WrbA